MIQPGTNSTHLTHYSAHRVRYALVHRDAPLKCNFTRNAAVGREQTAVGHHRLGGGRERVELTELVVLRRLPVLELLDVDGLLLPASPTSSRAKIMRGHVLVGLPE